MAQRKLASVIGAALAASAVLVGLMTPATAQSSGSSSTDITRALTSSGGVADSRAPEGGAKVVVFGDSHTSGTNAPFRTDERGCLKGANNWADQLQSQLGLGAGDLIDVSCSGASINSDGFHFSDEVRHAEARGAIGPNTTDIFVQLGKNDQWGLSNVNLLQSVQTCLTDVFAGCGDAAVAAGKMQDPNAVTAENYQDFTDSTKVYEPVSNQLDESSHPTKKVWLDIYNASDNFLSSTYQPLLQNYDDLMNLDIDYIGGDGQTESNITNRLGNPGQYDAFAINMVKTDNAASYTALLNQ